MEYFTLEHGHLASIIIPMFLLFNNIVDFTGEFFSRKYEKRMQINIYLPIHWELNKS